MLFGWFSDRTGRKADKWVARLGRPLSAHERAEFERWRSDARNAAAFERSRQVWSDTEGATRTSTTAARSPARVPTARRRKLAIAGVAALSVATAGVTLFGLSRAPGVTEHNRYVAASSRTIRLADGSIIDLGDDSELTTNFDGQTRALRLLRGHAQFTVAHDAAHPFIVTAGDQQVIARGTRFDIALIPNGMVVAMYQGVVEVRRARIIDPSEPGLRLSEGDRLHMVGNQVSVSHDARVAAIDAHWRAYVATPLGDVARDVTRQRLPGTPRIIVEDPFVAALKVDGDFNLADPRATARQLAAAFDLGLHATNDALVLSPRP